MYKLSRGKALRKRTEKNLKKISKKFKKMLDKRNTDVVWYTSCRRESAKARTEVRKTKIKNGIRKKWDFIWHNANRKVISVNFFKVLETQVTLKASQQRDNI